MLHTIEFIFNKRIRSSNKNATHIQIYLLLTICTYSKDFFSNNKFISLLILRLFLFTN